MGAFFKLWGVNSSRKTHWGSLAGFSWVDIGAALPKFQAFLELKMSSCSFLLLFLCLSLAAMPPRHNVLLLHWNHKHKQTFFLYKEELWSAHPCHMMGLYCGLDSEHTTQPKCTVHEITSFNANKFFQKNLSWYCRVPLWITEILLYIWFLILKTHNDLTEENKDFQHFLIIIP